jgi:predicted DNA-binding protein (MmcQ/YjbR family)
MIKLKHLLTEIVTSSEFDKVIKQAKKDTGVNHSIPSKTDSLCKEVGKLGINKYDYRGKKGKKRNVTGLMYRYYAYIQGWGHGKFKGPADWFLKGVKFDPILNWMYKHGYHKYFDYSYMRWHVTSDLQAAQIVADLRKGQKDVEPAYYLAKSYYNAFGQHKDRNVVFDYVVTKVEAWMKENNVETL